MEQTIKSRLESPEVDLTAETSSWGSLPPEVKSTIASVSDIYC